MERRPSQRKVKDNKLKVNLKEKASNCVNLSVVRNHFLKLASRKIKESKYSCKQAGAELGQAQLKLELDFTLIFCSFDLTKLTGWYSCSYW